MAPSVGGSGSLRPVLIGLAIAAVVMGGLASWFASTYPDGLEWSMAKVSGKEELESPAAGIHARLAKIQEKTAFLPDYGFKSAEVAPEAVATAEPAAAVAPEPWPRVSAGTSVAGIVGGLLTLALAGLIGIALRARSIQRACANG